MKKIMLFMWIFALTACDKEVIRVEVNPPKITHQKIPSDKCIGSNGYTHTIMSGNDVIATFEVCDGANGQDSDMSVILTMQALIELLETRVGNLEAQLNQVENAIPDIQFVKLCPNSTEYAIKQDTKLYAVGFTSENGGGLVLLTPNSQYYTTTSLTNACKFKVEADGTTSNHSYGHNISSWFETQPTTPVVPSIQGECLITKTENWNNPHYSFELKDSNGLVGDYTVELETSATSVGTDNHGSFYKVENVENVFRFKPISSTTSFTLYVEGATTINSAKVFKTSDPSKSLTCQVNNSVEN